MIDINFYIYLNTTQCIGSISQESINSARLVYRLDVLQYFYRSIEDVLSKFYFLFNTFFNVSALYRFGGVVQKAPPLDNTDNVTFERFAHS